MKTSKKLRALLERKSELVAEARKIDAAAEAENRDLTDEEIARQEEIVAQLKATNAAIEREQAIIEAEMAVEVPDDARIEGGAPRIEQDPRRGFQSYGDFCKAVVAAATDHVIDDRLRIGAAAPSTYAGENVGADGGFLVPPEFSRDIWELSVAEDSLLPLTDGMPVTGNSMVFPSDETTPWGTEGVRAYWEDEANAATATKPKLNPNTMRLKKLTALVPVTDELLSDSTGLDAYLRRKSAESIRWKTNDAIVNGSGVGRPKGFAGSGAEVTVAKETGQTADTITADNVTKMYARMLTGALGRAVWLMNPDALPQLMTMTVGNSPIWTPPNGGLQDTPAGRLLGRPIILTETCKTLGDKGDIWFVDLGSYRTITKAGGIETATSMHLYFDAGAMAFRAVFRIDGQPVLSKPVTPPNSANQRSAFVTLAERA